MKVFGPELWKFIFGALEKICHLAFLCALAFLLSSSSEHPSDLTAQITSFENNEQSFELKAGPELLELTEPFIATDGILNLENLKLPITTGSSSLKVFEIDN